MKEPTFNFCVTVNVSYQLPSWLAELNLYTSMSRYSNFIFVLSIIISIPKLLYFLALLHK